VITPRVFLAAVLLLPQLPQPIAGQAPAHPSCSAPRPDEKIALVLPGGGAKGYAHVGVIKMLDSLGIVPDLVVGTSMGSIMAGMYASGYSGEDIERLTRQFNIGKYIGRYYPRPPRAFMITGATGASMLGSQLPGIPLPVVLLKRGQGISLQTSIADEGAINLLLTALFIRGNLIARGNFDSLSIPFRAVGTDNRTGERIVLDHGDLAMAIRSSMAIPFVFQPGKLDSLELVDGGLSENVPVKLAREMGATRIILSTLDATRGLDSATRVKEKGTLDMMLDRIFLDTHPPLGPNDVEVRTDVSDIGNLDFAPEVVAKLNKRGSDAARKALVGACLPQRTRNIRPMPPLTTAIVTPNTSALTTAVLRHSVRPRQNSFKSLFRPDPPTTKPSQLSLDTVQIRMAYAGTSGVLHALWLDPERAPGDSVILDPEIEWGSQKTLGVGAAFDNDLGGQVWLGLANRRAKWGPLPAMEVGGRLTIGSERQEVLASFRKSIEDVHYSLSPFLVLMAGRESEPFFALGPGGVSVQVDLPLFTEQLIQVGLDVPIGDNWTVQVGPLLRNWHGGLTDSTTHPTPTGIAVRIGAGNDTHARYGRLDWELNQRFARGSGRASFNMERSFASFTNTVRAGGVTANAPYSQWFLLGGIDGFPGINIGESVGTWTASYMLDVAKPLFGPVNLQMTGMTGTISRSTDVNFGGEWLWGARVGIGSDAQIGMVRLQYGLASNGRRQWFARVGRWL